MISFAERMGLRSSRTIIQNDSLDEDTRVELWNTLVGLKEVFQELRSRAYVSDNSEFEFLRKVWSQYFKKPLDEMPSESRIWQLLKAEILNEDWFRVFDLIEEATKYLSRSESQRTQGVVDPFIMALNARFERYLVGYRFIGHEITRIDSTAEAEAVSAAIEDAGVVAGAHHSLAQAVELLADRETPDYPNSVKESISAVEAITKRLTGKTTLGSGLKELEAAGLPIHPALKDAWLKMYGWTSDEAGVRHGSIDSASIDQALAKYVLVTCSAFVSYLIEEGRKRGLLETASE